MNIRDGVVKYVLPEMVVYDDRNMDATAISNAVRDQISHKKGCRFIGEFFVERVPGNFHFATHGYAQYIHEILSTGISKH